MTVEFLFSASTVRKAYDRGAFGVPTFFAGGEMFWGNDRVVLLEHWLRECGRKDRS